MGVRITFGLPVIREQSLICRKYTTLDNLGETLQGEPGRVRLSLALKSKRKSPISKYLGIPLATIWEPTLCPVAIAAQRKEFLRGGDHA
jgi:hypothetical protein